MLSKKKKFFILFGMVALLVVTGCLNMFLTKSEDDIKTTNFTSTSLLTSYRVSKMETRNSMMEMYDSIIASSTDSNQNLEQAKEKQKTESKLSYLGTEVVREYSEKK